MYNSIHFRFPSKEGMDRSQAASRLSVACPDIPGITDALCCELPGNVSEATTAGAAAGHVGILGGGEGSRTENHCKTDP